MKRFIQLLMLCWAVHTHADFLPPDQAFVFEANSIAQGQAQLTWQAHQGYYLYHQQFKVIGKQPLILQLPKGIEKDDLTFGRTEVHYGNVSATVNLEPNQSYQVQWQGCADEGLCYPVQRKTIQTDAEGLLPNTSLPKSTGLLGATAQTQGLAIAGQTTPEAVQKNESKSTDQMLKQDGNKIQQEKPPNQKDNEVEKKESTEKVTLKEETVTKTNDILTQAEAPKSELGNQPTITEIAPQHDVALQTQPSSQSIASQWNNDQFFLNLLSDQSIFVSLLIFLGLGILLAFLPCSLPLIPILSGILVQKNTGYRAVIIASVFVFGMASVYAMMGLAVAQMGYSFQRLFQSSIFIASFAVLFLVFALNLFGLFQLSLPQGMLQKLDHWQQKQKGGTLVGAGMMGALSALIVGPCMSAPLAGALLFVSQTGQPMMGALYLFSLGLGIGIPLFIASVFGAQYLPKPGIWMDRLKFVFGFVMLGLALYFARPLLGDGIYLWAISIVFILLGVYCLWMALKHVQAKKTKISFIVLGLVCVSGGVWHVQQAIQSIGILYSSQQLSWQRVSTEDEFLNAIAQAKGQAVLIDVYADWCVACQPIEKEVLVRQDVQAELQDVVRIKLDLTHYHPSQDELLKQWQILGPPTMIFLDRQGQEQRQLRLTGTFRVAQLIEKLQQIKASI